MLSTLLDVLDEEKDADLLDSLLDKNDARLFNLISYYYAPKPAASSNSASSSADNSSSNTAPPQINDKQYTLQEKQLCFKIASFTAMHESHIFDAYDQLKASSIDTLTINEITVKINTHSVLLLCCK